MREFTHGDRVICVKEVPPMGGMSRTLPIGAIGTIVYADNIGTFCLCDTDVKKKTGIQDVGIVIPERGLDRTNHFVLLPEDKDDRPDDVKIDPDKNVITETIGVYNTLMKALWEFSDR